MYHYDAKIALEELQEEALLPHPVKLRDMILRTKLGPQDAQLLNHDFQDYLTRFGDLQKVARGILEKIAAGEPIYDFSMLSHVGGAAGVAISYGRWALGFSRYYLLRTEVGVTPTTMVAEIVTDPAVVEAGSVAV